MGKKGLAIMISQFATKGKNSVRLFYIKLYEKRIKKGYECLGIKKRLKQLNVVNQGKYKND